MRSPWLSLTAVLLAAVLACSEPAPTARWITLANHGTAGQAEPQWLPFPLALERFERREQDGALHLTADLPELARLRRDAPSTARLTLDGRTLPFVWAWERERAAFELGEGVFECTASQLSLLLPAGAQLPRELLLEVLVERGRVEDGVERVVLGNLVADGLAVWPGESRRLEVDVRADQVLRFQTAARMPPGDELRFRVHRDDELVHESTLSGSAELARERHELALPAGAQALTFSVEGERGISAFLEPVLGPAETGARGRRPWGAARPDVVLFLADTFRADNLESYGGALPLAPSVDALAERSLLFSQARSPSVWTLPAHTSMFTGLFPLQHGAITREQTFARSFVTLAEHFRSYGYRTAAITDALFVSHEYGMDQGFSWFEERPERLHDLTATLERADELLDADDGRPLFLFVHTYRVHEPYRVGVEEDARAAKQLEDSWKDSLRGLSKERARVRLEEIAAEFRALYQEGVRGFDLEFGPWLRGLEGRGLLEDGVLLFTSDHGEEFLEHGARRHGGRPHEEKIRVPFLLCGRGVEPGRSDALVTLLDLPPTLAQLAGLPALDQWLGSSVLELPEGRPVFAFNGNDAALGHFAVVRGPHKLFGHATDSVLGRGEFVEAFDLETDPGELAPVGTEASWPADLAREVAPVWQLLSEPLEPGASVELGAEDREDLEALGYGG